MEHPPGCDPPDQPQTMDRRNRERAELIENLAQLVVRQHRRQQQPPNRMPSSQEADEAQE
jgi:hypothetical protein